MVSNTEVEQLELPFNVISGWNCEWYGNLTSRPVARSPLLDLMADCLSDFMRVYNRKGVKTDA